MTCILYLSSFLDVRIDQTKQTQCCSDEANTVLPRRSKHSVTHLFSFLCYVFLLFFFVLCLMPTASCVSGLFILGCLLFVLFMDNINNSLKIPNE